METNKTRNEIKTKMITDKQQSKLRNVEFPLYI